MLVVTDMHEIEGSRFRSNIFVPVDFIHTSAFLRNYLSTGAVLQLCLLGGIMDARCLVHVSAVCIFLLLSAVVPSHRGFT